MFRSSSSPSSDKAPLVETKRLGRTAKAVEQCIIGFSAATIVLAAISSVALYYAVKNKSSKTINKNSILETKEITTEKAVVTNLSVHELAGQSPVEVLDDLKLNDHSITGVTELSAANVSVTGILTAKTQHLKGGTDDAKTITFGASSALSADYSFLLPDTAGASGEFLSRSATTGKTEWKTPSGAGNVLGPGSSVLNSIVTYGSTSGTLLRNLTNTITMEYSSPAVILTSTDNLTLDCKASGAITLGSGTGKTINVVGALALGTNAIASCGAITSSGALTCTTVGCGAITSSGTLTLGTNAIASCGAITSSGVVALTNTTVSTSVTTGALKVAGGLGVAGAIFGGTITSDGAVTTPGTVFCGSVSCAGTIDSTGPLVCTTVNCGTITSTGLILGTNAITSCGTINSSGVVTLTNTTASTSTTTGALKVAGGLGVAGAIFSGGAVSCGALTCGTVGCGAITSTGALALGANTITTTGAVSFGAVTCGTVGCGAITSTGALALGANTITTTGAVNGGSFTGNSFVINSGVGAANTITVSGPTTAMSNYSLSLPATAGSQGQVLSRNSGITTTWEYPYYQSNITCPLLKQGGSPVLFSSAPVSVNLRRFRVGTRAFISMPLSFAIDANNLNTVQFFVISGAFAQGANGENYTPAQPSGAVDYMFNTYTMVLSSGTPGQDYLPGFPHPMVYKQDNDLYFYSTSAYVNFPNTVVTIVFGFEFSYELA